MDKNFCLVLILTMGATIGGFALAQEVKPMGGVLGDPPTSARPSTLTKMHELEIEKQYDEVLLIQKDFQNEVAIYNSLLEKIKKEEGLPAEADIRVSPDHQHVTFTIPKLKPIVK